MKVRVKGDSVTIEGYVNVVERESEVLYDGESSFIEKIKQGAFAKSLRRRENVKVLFNHAVDRILATVAEGTASLREDAIGLWCSAKIRDAEVVKSAKEGRLVGWSFGFNALNEREIWTDETVRHREVLDLDLVEVSILDDTKLPAYPANCIMTRSLEDGKEEQIEYRSLDSDIELITEASSGGAADISSEKDGADISADSNYSFRNALLRASIH